MKLPNFSGRKLVSILLLLSVIFLSLLMGDMNVQSYWEGLEVQGGDVLDPKNLTPPSLGIDLNLDPKKALDTDKLKQLLASNPSVKELVHKKE